MDNTSFFSINLRRLRKSKGLSQDALAENANVSMHTILRAEQGILPKQQNILKIASALGVALSDLFADPNAPKVAPIKTVADMSIDELRAEISKISAQNHAPAPVQDTKTFKATYIDPIEEHVQALTQDPNARELIRKILKLDKRDAAIMLDFIEVVPLDIAEHIANNIEDQERPLRLQFGLPLEKKKAIAKES